MKKYMLLVLAIYLTGCSTSVSSDDDNSEEKYSTAVTLTHIKYGNIPNYITLSATTTYEDKATIAAPISAFIINSNVQPGFCVEVGDVLYTMESKEQRALRNNVNVPDASVPIKSGVKGVVLDIFQQEGSFVPEGTALCSIAETNSLFFEINVPYEQEKYVRIGKQCLLVLPDGTSLNATIQRKLVSMDVTTQSEKFLAHADTEALPDGMNVKVLISTDKKNAEETILLPKDAVQSDETLSKYWVMKLVNDSLAVKVPVEVGNSDAKEIEIHSASLSSSDRIILSGAYGLEDSSKVVITK